MCLAVQHKEMYSENPLPHPAYTQICGMTEPDTLHGSSEEWLRLLLFQLEESFTLSKLVLFS